MQVFLKGILTSKGCANVLSFVLRETLSPHADAACWGTACFCFLTDRPFGGPPIRWSSQKPQIAPLSLHQRSDRTLSGVSGRPKHNHRICFHSYLYVKCSCWTLKCKMDWSMISVYRQHPIGTVYIFMQVMLETIYLTINECFIDQIG